MFSQVSFGPFHQRDHLVDVLPRSLEHDHSRLGGEHGLYLLEIERNLLGPTTQHLDGVSRVLSSLNEVLDHLLLLSGTRVTPLRLLRDSVLQVRVDHFSLLPLHNQLYNHHWKVTMLLNMTFRLLA